MTTVKVGEKKISFPDGMRPEEIQDVIATYVNAAVDVGATITSDAVAEPVAGLTALATGDPDAVEGMTSRMTYQPRTEMGKRALNAIGTTMQSAVNAVGLEHMPGYWRDRVVPALQDSAGPIAGSALAAGSLAALAGLMNMGGGGRTGGFGRYQVGAVGSPKENVDLSIDYPSPGEPVLKVDKKKNKEFLSKGLSDAELSLQAERNRINEENIKTGNYDPYFNLEDRYYADPSNYSLEGNTLADTLPKTEAKLQEKIEQFDTDEARAALNAAYDDGSLGSASSDWYAMGQLEDEFIKVLGPIEGPKAFKERFADAMAATTGGADPGSNLLMAAYGNFLRSRGESPPSNAYSMPHPIGGRYVTGNMKMYDKVINEGAGLTTAGQPKRHNFSANFLGDTKRATIDEQMTKGMTQGALNAPPSLTYGVFEKILGDEAAKRGIDPANMQDVAWAGFKGQLLADKKGAKRGSEEYSEIMRSQGKPMMEWFNEMTARTSMVTGKPQKQVVEGFIKGTMPMYTLAGAAVTMNELQQQLRQSEEE
tara:strand:+ start:1608 stop:3218 length:1611 start_codon:yes stop_codon:yes gene_type:complete